MLATVIFPPALIMIGHGFFKYLHESTARKDKTLKGLRDSEFFWSILANFEAGIESSGQLMVQAWLISKIFFDEDKLIQQIEFMGIIRGMLLSDNATPLEISAGKMLLSIVSVVLSIGGCYRFQKRGAITLVDMIPIYLSLLTQILFRTFAFIVFFSTGQGFKFWMPSIFVIHMILVLAIKICFEVDWRCHEGLFKLALLRRFIFALMGSATSFLVYVDIRDAIQRDLLIYYGILLKCFFTAQKFRYTAVSGEGRITLPKSGSQPLPTTRPNHAT